MNSLFDPGTRERWTGSRALSLSLVRPDGTCRICGGRWENRWTQPALIRHGGYGATDSFLVVGCDCGALAMTYRHASNPRADR